MKKPGNKKLLKSNRISGFQKADHQKLPIDKTRRIISQKFHFFKIFKVGLIGALIFGILFELALEHVPGLLLWSIYGIIVTVILKESKRTIASTCSYASFSAIIVSHDTESKKLST